MIAHVAERHGDAPFIVGEDGDRISFVGFRERVAGLARALIAYGVELGDRVAIWAPNSPAWIVAASAIESIGAIMVPINTRFKGAEAAFVLDKTRACLLFTVTSFLGNHYVEMLRKAGAGADDGRPVRDLPALRTIIDLDDGLLAFEAARAEDDQLVARLSAVRPETIADILAGIGA